MDELVKYLEVRGKIFNYNLLMGASVFFVLVVLEVRFGFGIFLFSFNEVGDVKGRVVFDDWSRV